LLVQIGDQISNNVVLPVANGSRTCTPTQPILAGNVFQQLTTSTNALGFGDLVLQRVAANCGTPPCQPAYQDQAKADFASVTIPPADQPFVISYLDVPPVGTCVVQNKANPVTPYTTANGLDAGNITLTGPKGNMALTEKAGSPTTYSANLGPGNYLAAGNYSFSSTGKDLPAFNVPISIPALPTWTNQPSGTIVRTSPLNITWTAGGQDTYVDIQGTSYTDNTNTVGAIFSCIADANALSFTVPANILEQLPAGSGTLLFVTGLRPANFSVAGLDYGSVRTHFQTVDYVTYK